MYHYNPHHDFVYGIDGFDPGDPSAAAGHFRHTHGFGTPNFGHYSHHAPPPLPQMAKALTETEEVTGHVHRPTLDPQDAEIVREFFKQFEELPDEDRKRIRERWNARGRPAVVLAERFLMREAKFNSRQMRPFHALPPPSQALTEKDLGYAHRLSILLGTMMDLPDISVSLKGFSAYTIGAAPDRRPRTVLSDFYRLPCLRPQQRSPVLDDVTVHFAPGGMHLIIGPPLSGKTAMLQALAGRFRGAHVVTAKLSAAMGSRPLLVSGDQLENGKPKLLSKRNPLLYAEAAQYEHHVPTLTVYETVDFANVLRSIDLSVFPDATTVETILLPALRRLRSRNLLNLFGIQGSADTMVGDGIVVRGISGGQRRRVTSAEPLAGLVRVMLLDVPTNGLDTATAAEICRDIRVLGFALRQTVIMALMQPPPEVFTLFTTVTMLDEGAVVYHGPIASAERYFECLGFRRSEGVDLADYLIDMCTHRRERFHSSAGGRGASGARQSAGHGAGAGACTQFGSGGYGGHGGGGGTAAGIKDFVADRGAKGANWAVGPPVDRLGMDFGLIKKKKKGYGGARKGAGGVGGIGVDPYGFGYAYGDSAGAMAGGDAGYGYGGYVDGVWCSAVFGAPVPGTPMFGKDGGRRGGDGGSDSDDDSDDDHAHTDLGARVPHGGGCGAPHSPYGAIGDSGCPYTIPPPPMSAPTAAPYAPPDGTMIFAAGAPVPSPHQLVGATAYHLPSVDLFGNSAATVNRAGGRGGGGGGGGGLFSRLMARVLGRDTKPVIGFNDPNVIAGSLDMAAAMEAAAASRLGAGGPDAAGARRGVAMVDGEDVLTREGLVATWAKSSLHKDTLRAIDISADGAAAAEATPLYKTRWATSSIDQFSTLASRQWRITTRTPAFLQGRLMAALCIGIILGTLFYGLPLSYDFAVARVGLLFYVAMAVGFGAMNDIGPWIQERAVFTKHHRLHFFKLIPYVAATTLMALPVSLLEGFVMGTIVWWMCLPNPMFYRYIYFVIVLVLLSFVIASMLRFISVIAKTDVIGSAFAVILILGCVVFCGFVLPVRRIPPWMIWIYWANPVKWGLEAIAIIVLNKQTFFCEPHNLVTVFEVPPSAIDAVTDQGLDFSKLPPLYHITNSTTTPTFTTSIPSALVCPFTTGREALDSIGFFQDEFWIFANMAILLGMSIGMIVLSAIGLTLIQFEEDHNIRFPMQRAAADGELPDCPPIPLIWRGISYAVNVNGGWKPLIANVSGYALPGTMTALMGESGAGKTTLMDVVAHRKLQGKAEGIIMLGPHDVSSGLPKETSKAAGFAKKESDGQTLQLLKAACGGDKKAQAALKDKERRKALLIFKASTGYVLQFDTLCPYETVRESIEFSAALRLVGVSAEERKKRVDMCLRLMELEPVADVQVGGTTEISGVSDSQRKLTSIAVELVANPPVIFLDEPTTGLDPQGAVVVIEALRRVADQGRAVLATIHQPSMRLFTAFDRLLLLMRGGRTVYFGPIHSKGAGDDIPTLYSKGGAPTLDEIKKRVGQSTNGGKRVEDCGLLKKYFGAHKGVPECGDDQNPASWMLDVIGAGASSSATKDFADIWARSKEGYAAKKETDALIAAYNSNIPSDSKSSRRDVFAVTAERPHKGKHHEGLDGHADGDSEAGTQVGAGYPGIGGPYAAAMPTSMGGIGCGLHHGAPHGGVGPYAGGALMGAHGGSPSVHPGALGLGVGGGAVKPDFGATGAGGAAGGDDGEPKIRTGIMTQLYWVTWRIGRMCWRAPGYSLNRIVMAALLGIFFGFAYWRLDRDILGVQAIFGFSYMSMLFLVAMAAIVALPFWFAHKPCYNREALGTRMYSPVVFGIALTIVDFGYVLATVVAFVGPAYWIIDLGPDARTFWTYFFIIFLSVLWGTYFGQLLVFSQATLPDAQVFFGVLMPLIDLFNGFIIKRTQIPPMWIWVYYANPFRWLLEALLVTMMKPIDHVDCSSLHQLDQDPMLVIDCPTKTGDDFIAQYDMWPSMQWPDIAIFIAWTIIFRLLGFVALVLVKPPAT